MIRKVTCRLACPGDVDPLLHVVNTAYRSAEGWTNESKLVSGLRVDKPTLEKIIDTTTTRVLSTAAMPTQVLLVLVENDSTVIGSVCLQLSQRDVSAQQLVLLGMFSIRPDLQNFGLGKHLLAASERWIAENWTEAKSIEISVMEPRVELIRWYERRGFVRTGAMEQFPYHDPNVGSPLRDGLQFVVLDKRIA